MSRSNRNTPAVGIVEFEQKGPFLNQPSLTRLLWGEQSSLAPNTLLVSSRRGDRLLR